MAIPFAWQEGREPGTMHLFEQKRGLWCWADEDGKRPSLCGKAELDLNKDMVPLKPFPGNPCEECLEEWRKQ